MTKKLLLTTAAVAGGFFDLTGQPAAPPPVFTAAQAAAGRRAYASTCGKCHRDTLSGRKGEPGELPPLSSLPAGMQSVVNDAGGIVPPLAGDEFMAKWGPRTTRDLARRINEAVGGFRPENSNENTYLDLTAYFLEANGARPGTQALTAATAVEVRSLATGAAGRSSPR